MNKIKIYLFYLVLSTYKCIGANQHWYSYLNIKKSIDWCDLYLPLHHLEDTRTENVFYLCINPKLIHGLAVSSTDNKAK